MELEHSDARRRGRFFSAICSVGLAVLVGYSLFNYVAGNLSAMGIQIAMAPILAGSLLALFLGVEDRKVYWIVLLVLCYLATIGLSRLYFHLALPLLFFFLLGRRDGFALTTAFLLGLCAIILTPWLAGDPVYAIGTAIRFVVAYFFVTILAWAWEGSRVRFHRLLTAKNEHLNAVLGSVPDGIVTIDEHATIRSFNPAAERIFGYPASEVVGQNVKILMPEPFRTEHDRYVGDYLRTGAAKVIGIGREVVGRRRDGSEFPVELAISATRLETGRRLFVGVTRDVTDRRRQEEQLERKAVEAGLLNQTTTAVSESKSFNEALKRSVDVIRRATGWPIGHVCLPSASGDALEPSDIWSIAGGHEYPGSWRSRRRRGSRPVSVCRGACGSRDGPRSCQTCRKTPPLHGPRCARTSACGARLRSL